jgi:hypothetical protein
MDVPLKRRWISTELHRLTTQETVLLIVTAVRTSSLIFNSMSTRARHWNQPEPVQSDPYPQPYIFNLLNYDIYK